MSDRHIVYIKIIIMNSCFVSRLKIDSIFITFDFTAIQSGVYFLLPTTVDNSYKRTHQKLSGKHDIPGNAKNNYGEIAHCQNRIDETITEILLFFR